MVQPGAVIGGDGFGFAPERGTWLKVPQVGSVRVGADVEIGANTTIDRGAIEDTVIEEGVKLDNLIMIAHNVRIGAHTAIAACIGISGSTTIGKRCMIGGMAALPAISTSPTTCVITGYSMISHSIERAGVYSSGIPFEEAHTWRRLVARFKRLGLLADRVRKLEQAHGRSQPSRKMTMTEALQLDMPGDPRAPAAPLSVPARRPGARTASAARASAR